MRLTVSKYINNKSGGHDYNDGCFNCFKLNGYGYGQKILRCNRPLLSKGLRLAQHDMPAASQQVHVLCQIY